MVTTDKKGRLMGGMESFETWCWRRALWVPWTSRKMGKWVPEQMNPETPPEAKVTKPKLSHFGHIVRKQGSFGKDNNAGKY